MLLRWSVRSRMKARASVCVCAARSRTGGGYKAAANGAARRRSSARERGGAPSTPQRARNRHPAPGCSRRWSPGATTALGRARPPDHPLLHLAAAKMSTPRSRRRRRMIEPAIASSGRAMAYSVFGLRKTRNSCKRSPSDYESRSRVSRHHTPDRSWPRQRDG